MSFSQVIHILSYDNPGGKKSIYIYIYIYIKSTNYQEV